jgi:hypothetical protein
MQKTVSYYFFTVIFFPALFHSPLTASLTGYSRGTCTPMFIAALFTIAKFCKQPRGPITDEWIKKMWYLYTMEIYAAMKKNKMLSFAVKWMEF